MKLFFYIKNFFTKRKWEAYKKDCNINFSQYNFNGVIIFKYSSNKLPFKYKAFVSIPSYGTKEINLDELSKDDDFNKLIINLKRKEKLERLKYEN